MSDAPKITSDNDERYLSDMMNNNRDLIDAQADKDPYVAATTAIVEDDAGFTNWNDELEKQDQEPSRANSTAALADMFAVPAVPEAKQKTARSESPKPERTFEQKKGSASASASAAALSQFIDSAAVDEDDKKSDDDSQRNGANKFEAVEAAPNGVSTHWDTDDDNDEDVVDKVVGKPTKKRPLVIDSESEPSSPAKKPRTESLSASADDEEETMETTDDEAPISAMGLARALDSQRDMEEDTIEAQSAEFMGSLFGSQFGERVRKHVDAVLRQNGASVKRAARQSRDIVYKRGAPGLVAGMHLATSILSVTNSSIGDWICGCVPDGAPEPNATSYERKARSAVYDIVKSATDDSVNRLRGLRSRPPKHNLQLLPLATMLLASPPTKMHTKSLGDNKMLALTRFAELNRPFIGYTMRFLQAFGLFASMAKPTLPTPSPCYVSELPEVLRIDRRKCDYGLAYLFAPTVDELHAKPSSPLPPSKLRRTETAESVKDAASEFRIESDPIRDTVTATHHEALVYSIEPLLRMNRLSDVVVVTPNSTLIDLLRVRDRGMLRNTELLRRVSYAITQDTMQNNMYMIVRIFVAVSEPVNAAMRMPWVEKVHGIMTPTNENGIVEMFKSWQELVGEQTGLALLHTLAGFLRADADLDIVYTPARVASRMLAHDAGELSASAQSVGLAANELLPQHTFHMTPLAKRVYVALFVHYCRVIGFDPDAGKSHEHTNMLFDTKRREFAERAPVCEEMEQCAKLLNSDDAEKRKSAIFHASLLVPIVNALFPLRSF